VAVVGDEDEVVAQLGALAGIGANEVLAAPFGGADERRRTTELLAHLASTPP
jgi:hypothetical protein